MTQTTYQSIGQFIKNKREEAGMTQDQLATKLNVSPATISLYESGDRKPEIDTLKLIAKTLSVSEAALLDIKVDGADLDLALRSEKLDPNDIMQVRRYIQLIKMAKNSGPKDK